MKKLNIKLKARKAGKAIAKWFKFAISVVVGWILIALEYLLYVIDRQICVLSLNTYSAFGIWKTIPEWKRDAVIRIVFWGVVITLWNLIF